MNAFTQKPTLVLGTLLGGIIFSGCSSVTTPSNQALQETTPEAAAKISAPQASADFVSQVAQATPAPRPRPQLIKKAAMTLIVDSVEQSIDAVSQIIDKQQGDLIRLEERQPQNEYARHSAFIQLRVPQKLLEPTLEELGKLGTVQNRNITTEDVGDRLVDIQARLTNLRKTETSLQKIMERAGSVKDILSVAKELSRVRQSIEQIDAQLKSLQNQVTYSTITLNLEAAISSSSPQRSLDSQIKQAWNNSTHSLSEFTVSLLKMGIWLIVYSPYLLILVAAGYGLYRWQRNSSRISQRPESASSE
ncbi:MAG: DUF4349 domain-containing protein [Nostocaceae cyanobacterium]|nr:DUF4349 domain-containing protein [Nostocaceae cyanobacterium]